MLDADRGPGRSDEWPPGYVLNVDPGDVDARRFEGASGATAVRADGEPLRPPRRCATRSRSGAGPRWPTSRTSRRRDRSARLEELRTRPSRTGSTPTFALGRHRELAAELQALVAEQPLRERRRGQLMLALYRSGRQAEALAAYRGARRCYVDENGIEPPPAAASSS